MFLFLLMWIVSTLSALIVYYLKAEKGKGITVNHIASSICFGPLELLVITVRSLFSFIDEQKDKVIIKKK